MPTRQAVGVVRTVHSPEKSLPKGKKLKIGREEKSETENVPIGYPGTGFTSIALGDGHPRMSFRRSER